MATNKNASIRYQVLDKCFRDFRHRYYIDDLIDKCEEALLYYNGQGGVSRRQIFEDIKFMESDTGWSIPLERKPDGKKVYYRYEDEDFTINEQPLTDDEARQMESIIITLSRFRGMPCNEWVEEVISNLEWRFNLNRNEQNVIGFEQVSGLRGLQYLSTVIDAAVHHQVLRVTYKSYKIGAVEKTMMVHPYYVKQYNNRWFLLALENETRYISNLALDRIQGIEVAEDVRFIPNTDIDFDTYFNDVIGVTIPRQDVLKEHILLQISSKQFAYIKAKPLHQSQTIVDEEKHIISIDVRPNYELDYHILSLGDAVEVLEPVSYREHIKEKLMACLNKYNVVQEDCTGNI